jgi:hypothetical protein
MDHSFNCSGLDNLLTLLSFVLPYFRYRFFDIVDVPQAMVCTWNKD